jgi:23S rRNA (cytosine1962-C5)-methyltransferase
MQTYQSVLAQVPSPAERRIALRVTPAAERAIRQGHPWVFDQAITEQSHSGQPGDLAVIFDEKRRFLAVGFYDPISPLRVRILQQGQPTPIDAAWFHDKLTAAAQLRSVLNDLPSESATTGYRLVHGENDGLPGLVIDRYADTLVIKLYSPAWVIHLRDICSTLAQECAAERLILRLSRAIQKHPDHLYGMSDGQLLDGIPLDGPLLFQENGLTFEAEPILGQKTGFFLDQRDNRARVERLSQGKTVLNVFAYSGGFSVYAARGGAKRVVSVDLSAPALQAAERNMAHNRHISNVAAAQHETVAQDAFDVLVRMHNRQERFDVVILDPPMFAQNQAQIATALAAYRKLTHLGLDVLRSGGTLVQASCSSRVDADHFFNAIHQAARDAGRPLNELERTAHALDHPIRFKEGAYLKCLFAVAQ